MCGGFEEHAAEGADTRGAETSCEIEVRRLVVLCAVRPVGPFRRFARIRVLTYAMNTAHAAGQDSVRVDSVDVAIQHAVVR